MRAHRKRKTKTGWQTCRNIDPIITRILALVHVAVVLSAESVGTRQMRGTIMRACAGKPLMPGGVFGQIVTILWLIW
jgi:hypothetical protein